MDEQLCKWIATTGRIFGTLFYYPPKSDQVRKILPLFMQPNWSDQIGLEISSELQDLMQQQTNLDEQYQALFIGPNTLIAPPWGSVYLDPESVIFGQSYLGLSLFLRKNQIEYSLKDNNDPEDHFGLMLMLSAYLVEYRIELLPEFLSQHFFTWSERYLELLTQQSEYPFYKGLGLISRCILNEWKSQLHLEIPEVKLYH